MFRYLKPPPKKKTIAQFNIYLTTLITVGMICFIFDFSFFIIYFQIEILKVERGLPHLITENESVNTATGKYQLINLLGYDMNFGQIQDFILFFLYLIFCFCICICLDSQVYCVNVIVRATLQPGSWHLQFDF